MSLTMMVGTVIVVVLLFASTTTAIPKNSFYLVDIDNSSSSSNDTFCTNLLINDQIYRIPSQCRKHLMCDPTYCDDQSFRCVKVRESLCCLLKYLQNNCQHEDPIKIKDNFRAIYFHMSIEHGYCEINLERIETNDNSYCIAVENGSMTTITSTTTTTTTTTTTLSHIRTLFKHFHRRRPSATRTHRFRHRVAARHNQSLPQTNYIERVTILKENVSAKAPAMPIPIVLFALVSCFLSASL